MAAAIRQTIAALIKVHRILKNALDRGTLVTASDLKLFTTLPKPTAYEASADKIGLLDALAPNVTSFFMTMDRIGVSVDVVANVPPKSPINEGGLKEVVALIEDACRKSLPLLEALPADADDADIKLKIEDMSKP